MQSTHEHVFCNSWWGQIRSWNLKKRRSKQFIFLLGISIGQTNPSSCKGFKSTFFLMYSCSGQLPDWIQIQCWFDSYLQVKLILGRFARVCQNLRNSAFTERKSQAMAVFLSYSILFAWWHYMIRNTYSMLFFFVICKLRADYLFASLNASQDWNHNWSRWRGQ